jgi:carbon monoxide dehydrogenase subunit G
MQEVEHISIYIDRLPNEVYAFASNPENLSRWAAGLASSEVKRDGDAWTAEAPFGKVRIRFAEKNNFGVMDHDVELEPGVVVHNPMRVVPNGNGSEFIFTLLRQSGMSDEEFADDKRAIEQDLATLKGFLEGCS